MAKITTRDKCLFLGGYRQGKTTGAKWMMQQRVARGGRFAWYDPPWEAQDVDAAAVVVRKLADVEKPLREGKNVVYQPAGGGTREDMDAFVGTCNSFPNIIVVIDEAHLFLSHSTPADKIPNLNHLIRLGHKWGRGMWLISHRLSDFPGSARNVHHVFHFKTFATLDVESARDLFGDLADQLKTLPAFCFLYWGPDHGAVVSKPLPVGASAAAPASSSSSRELSKADETVSLESDQSGSG